MTSVAPKALARLSFDPTRSMAMIRDAPAIAAPVHRREPHPAATDDRDGGPRLHGRGVEDRPDPGGDPAADEGRAIEGHVLADLHQGVLVHDHLLGERGEVRELVDGPAVRGGQQPRGVLGGLEHLAERHAPDEAVLALAAEDGEARDHVVAGLDVGDRVSHRLDHPRRLVPEDHRELVGVRAVHEVQIAVAHPGGRGAHEHLPRPRLRDRDLLDLERLSDLPQDGCPHLSSSS